jgi:hypothetical protein
MTRSHVLSSVALAVLVFSLGGSVAAKPPGDAEAKPPAASKQFGAALKNFAKATSYKVEVAIEGGISGTPDHQVRDVTVNEKYAGAIHDKVMHVPELKAYRTTSAGVISSDGVWKQILADQRGVRLDRLFSFPEKLLARAAKHAAKAEWLDAGPKEKAEDAGEARSSAKKAAEKTEKSSGAEKDPKKGRTVVKGASKPDGAAVPRLLRIEVPPKEALTHFIEVENSGCMSAG